MWRSQERRCLKLLFYRKRKRCCRSRRVSGLVRYPAVAAAGRSGHMQSIFRNCKKQMRYFLGNISKRKNLKGFMGNGALSVVCFCISRQGFFVLHDRCRKSHVYRKKCFGGFKGKAVDACPINRTYVNFSCVPQMGALV